MTETVTLANGRTFNVANSGPRLKRGPEPKPHKYGARSVVIDGLRFASQREGNRWLALKDRQTQGEISQLERQVVYVLAPSVRIAGETRARPALRFTADFRYVENGKTVVEDAKGFADTAFKIRQHLMATVHGIHVRRS